MILEQHPDIKQLSPLEKFILVGELWDDLSEEPSEVPVSPAIVEELERRAEEYRRNPGAVVPWAEAKARILSSKKQ